MRLSAKPIIGYIDNNHWKNATEIKIRQGEANVLYFQLVDLEQDSIRYMSEAAVVSMNVVFPSLSGDTTKIAIVADAVDNSIWKVNILDTDVISGGNVKFEITEDGVTKRFWAYDVVSVEPGNPSGCCGCSGAGCGDC